MAGTSEKAAPLTAISDTAGVCGFEDWSAELEFKVVSSLPGERKAAVVAIASTIAVVATVAPVAFVITAQESATIGLRATIVSSGIATAIPVKVRSLRIIILTPLRVVRAGEKTVLIALVYRHLAAVTIAPIVPVVAIGAIVAIVAVIAIGPIVAVVAIVIDTATAVVAVTIIVTVPLDPITFATIPIRSILTRIAVPVSIPAFLRQRRRTQGHSNTYK